MSSLLQFQGKIANNRVYLQFVTKDESETYLCEQCGRQHQFIYVAPRKPVGMFGCWVLFRYNGEKHAPDLSCPIITDKLPRDAKKMTEEESSKLWHT